MADSNAVRVARYQEKIRGGPPRKLIKCPSWIADARHKARVKRGEPSDCTDVEGCRLDYNKHQTELYAKRQKALLAAAAAAAKEQDP